MESSLDTQLGTLKYPHIAESAKQLEWLARESPAGTWIEYHYGADEPPQEMRRMVTALSSQRIIHPLQRKSAPATGYSFRNEKISGARVHRPGGGVMCIGVWEYHYFAQVARKQ